MVSLRDAEPQRATAAAQWSAPSRSRSRSLPLAVAHLVSKQPYTAGRLQA